MCGFRGDGRTHDAVQTGGASEWFSPLTTPVESVQRTVVSRAMLRTAAKIWLVLLIAGSLQPGRPGIVTGGGGIHREIHWVAFGGAALLLFALSQTLRQEILRAGALFFLGLSIEVLQYLVNRNRMEWRDVRDDGIAIVVAFALYRLTGAWKPTPDLALPNSARQRGAKPT
jgi:hypothetical protein